MSFNNLNTDGGEFILPNGNDYIGPYHVHVNKGAMVGGFHTSQPHDSLRPINKSVEERIKNLQSHLKSHMGSESQRQVPSRTSTPPPAPRTPRATQRQSSSRTSGGSYGY